MRDSIRISLVQFPENRDASPDATADRLPAFFKQAAAYGSDVIAFPEYVLGRHVTLDHPPVQTLMQLAGEHNMYAVGGIIERLDETKYATTALLVGRDGKLIGRYVKAHPAAGIGPWWWPPVPGHDEEARSQLGDGFKAWDLDWGKLGIIQCYDGYFPESWGCTSFAGAEVILWINGRPSSIQDAHCIYPAHAYACVVGANVSDGGNTGFAEPMYGRFVHSEGTREEGRLFPRIAEPGDGIVHATIDLNQLRALRKHHRMQHQRRPELYGRITQHAKMWEAYPDVEWSHPDAPDYVNKAQL